MENDNTTLINRCHSLVTCIANFTMLVGLSVIVGSYYHIILLTSISSDWVNMKINTAIGFFLSGCGLLLLNNPDRKGFFNVVFISISLCILLMSGLTIIEYLFDKNIGIDEWLMKDILPLQPDTVSPGRMAFLTGVNFLLIGIVYLSALKKNSSIWLLQTAAWLILLTTSIAIFNYFYGVNITHHFAKYSMMAINTIFLFSLISVGILLTKPDAGVVGIILGKNNSGYLLRRVIIIPFIIVSALIYLIIYFEKKSIIDSFSVYVLIQIINFIITGVMVLLAALILDYKEKQLLKIEMQIKYDAEHDLLTGLSNRSALEAALNKDIADRKSAFIAVMVLDVDRFKLINEAFGHAQGDLILKSIALRLADIEGHKKINLSRLGADKFVLYFVGVGEKDVYDFAQHVHHRLTTIFEITKNKIILSVSVGIALYPHDGMDFKTLAVNAELAVNEAKSLGGNRIQFFSQKLAYASSKTISMDVDMRMAMQGGQFFLAYQPQIDLNTGEIHAVEVLARWRHPINGLMLPNEFISFAERNNLIVALNEHIAHLAFQQFSAHLPEIPFSINISAQQFKDGFHLVEHFETLMKKFGVSAKNIELEITENMLLDDTEHNIAVLTALHELGFNIVIDDFGTGFSSFGYLKRLPIQKIKIDESFISKLPDNEANVKIVKAIIAMAHSLGKIVVAEGAETQAEVDFLKKEKCDIVQGFYYHKPMPFDEFIELTKKTQNGGQRE